MIILLMAPEALADLGEQPWLRDATPAESELFKTDHPHLDGIDGIGRPYFTVAIDETQCPPKLAQKAKATLRLRWLPNDWNTETQ
jgi:hypothetical protein